MNQRKKLIISQKRFRNNFGTNLITILPCHGTRCIFRTTYVFSSSAYSASRKNPAFFTSLTFSTGHSVWFNLDFLSSDCVISLNIQEIIKNRLFMKYSNFGLLKRFKFRFVHSFVLSKLF